LAYARAEHLLGRALLTRDDARDARAHLRRAMDVATRCGCRTLATEARDLLVAAGGRVHRPVGSALDLLTGAERRVAALAGDGLTNRQVAESLFVTVRTVELHLSTVYRKLGIAGRAELPAALTDER